VSTVGLHFEKTDTKQSSWQRRDDDVESSALLRSTSASQSAAVKAVTATSRSSSSIAGRAGWSREGHRPSALGSVGNVKTETASRPCKREL
jgi:hypothetical protein